MKNLCSQRKQGFSFIEVVIAIAIIGTILTSLLSLLGAVFRATYQVHARTERMLMLRNLFFNQEDIGQLLADPTREIKRTIQEPMTELKFFLVRPKEGSQLAKRFQDTWLVQAKAEWQEFGRKQDEILVGMQYKKVERTTV